MLKTFAFTLSTCLLSLGIMIANAGPKYVTIVNNTGYTVNVHVPGHRGGATIKNGKQRSFKYPFCFAHRSRCKKIGYSTSLIVIGGGHWATLPNGWTRYVEAKVLNCDNFRTQGTPQTGVTWDLGTAEITPGCHTPRGFKQ